MKRASLIHRRHRFKAVFAALLAFWIVVDASGADLEFEVAPRFNGQALRLDELATTNSFGQSLSVNRLDFLLSDFSFRSTSGKWIRAAGYRAFVSVRMKRLRFRLGGIPAGEYDRVRFHVGLAPKVNHSDPAQYGAQDPLNPVLNGLHWSWRDGYVFFALEGKWLAKSDSSSQSGYSYHLGNDQMFTVVETRGDIATSNSGRVELVLNLDSVFGGEAPLKIDAEKTSTHARGNDPLAEQIRGNLRAAFSIRQLHEAGSRTTDAEEATAPKKRVLIAADATPYRFTYGRHFPAPGLPLDNPLTEDGVALGRRLFQDPILSVNRSQSCSGCHQPKGGFVDAGRSVSLGAEGNPGRRNSMPLFNLAWKRKFFWDGRAPSLRAQVLMPIQNPVEMHETLPSVVGKLRAHSEYPVMFERAFGDRMVDADRMARALEQFLLTIVSYDSRFDLAMKKEAELTEEEKRGFFLFMSEYDPRRGMYGADCFHCHGGPLFSSNGFFNNGLDEKFEDGGLGEITGRTFDVGRFSAPSLRNVELTAPYMHDGRFQTLEEVVAHYSSGIKRSPSLDANLAKHPAGGIQLKLEDQRALVAFLKTLTDDSFRN